MADYRIRLLSSAETAGLQQTKQATDDLTKSTKDLNAEMQRANQAWRDGRQPAVAHAATLDRAATAANNATNKTASLADGLKKAQTAIPGLNFALGSLTNVWTILAAAVVGVVSKINEWDAVVKRNEAREAGLRALNKEMARFSENTQQARLEVEALNREINAIRGEEDTPEAEGARATASTRRRFEAARARAQGQRQVGIDTIARRQAAGEITPAEAAQARLQLTASTEKELRTLELNEAAELAGIQRRVAGAEGGRAAQLRARIPAAQEGLTSARNARDDARRAFQGALAFGGLNEDLSPIPGGRAAEIEAEIASRFPSGTFDNPLDPDAFAARERLRGELASLRSGATFARDNLTGRESDLAAAQDRFTGLRSELLGAERAARRLGLASSEADLGFQASTNLAGITAGFSERSVQEQSATIKLNEATRQLEEASRKAEEIVRNLGRTGESQDRLLNAVKGLLQQTLDTEGRAKARLQSE